MCDGQQVEVIYVVNGTTKTQMLTGVRFSRQLFDSGVGHIEEYDAEGRVVATYQYRQAEKITTTPRHA
jgi:hypothetical protein